jgi:hypothetical protein
MMIPGIMAQRRNSLGPLPIDPNVGIVWTGRLAAQNNQLFGVAWSPTLNLFVSVASSGTNRVQTSTDGFSWVVRNAPDGATPSTWRAVTWVGALSLFVAVADSGTHRVMTSSDGINWTSRSTTIVGFDVAWSPLLNKLVVIGYTAPHVHHSANGVTWETGTGPSAGTWVGVCWSAEQAKFVAVGYGGILATSTDGATWTSQPSTANVQLTRVVWVPSHSIYVATAQTPTTNLYTSTDGLTWTPRAAGIAGSLYGVTIGAGLIVALSSDTGTAQKITTSPDGLTWTPRGPITNTRLQGVVWADSVSKFVAVGQSPSAGVIVFTSL